MAILDSIAIEIQATIAGALILLIITILEFLDLRRARKEHGQDLQAIASATVPPLKKRLISPFSLVLEFIFGYLRICFVRSVDDVSDYPGNACPGRGRRRVSVYRGIDAFHRLELQPQSRRGNG
jgi:hypothetical protein